MIFFRNGAGRVDDLGEVGDERAPGRPAELIQKRGLRLLPVRKGLGDPGAASPCERGLLGTAGRSRADRNELFPAQRLEAR